MRRLGAATLGLLMVVAAACTSEPRDTDPVDVVRSGFSYRQDQLGVAAAFRVTDARVDIPVTIGMFAGDRSVGSEQSVLPFCPPSTECWWGERFSTGSAGSDLSEVDRVEVSAGAGRASRAEHEITELHVEAKGDRATIEPTDAGVAYLIVTRDERPVWGSFTHVARADGRIASEGVLAEDETMRAFLYVGAFPDAPAPGAD